MMVHDNDWRRNIDNIHKFKATIFEFFKHYNTDIIDESVGNKHKVKEHGRDGSITNAAFTLAFMEESFTLNRVAGKEKMWWRLGTGKAVTD